MTTAIDFSATVLVVEDEDFSRRFFEMILREAGSTYVGAASLREGSAYLATQGNPDLVILDLRLPDGNGMELFRALRSQDNSVPVIIITAYGSIADAVGAMKEGAYDFITKPFDDINKIRIAIKNALEHGRLTRENLLLRAKLQSPTVFHNIIGKSRQMEHVFFLIQKAAQTRSTVLIEGGSGTGKELVAKAIHDLSDRREHSFITVNCGALPETLLEAALFGHEKGAFTGADRMTKGFFEEAHGGTLFLDEIGDAPPALQVKILRAVEYGKIYRVGSAKPVTVDVRFLFATHKDLGAEVAGGRFRHDLFFRINVVNIALPPLDDRKEDIPMLVKHFADKICLEIGGEKKEFSDEAISSLCNRSWPGNIRELKNLVERIIALHSGKKVSAGDLTVFAPGAQIKERESFYDDEYGVAQQHFDKKYFDQLIARCRGDLNLAAKQSGVHRATIYRKLKELDIKVK